MKTKKFDVTVIDKNNEEKSYKVKINGETEHNMQYNPRRRKIVFLYIVFLPLVY